MSKEWIFSDDFKIKFSDRLFNEFMSTDNFKWTDELVKEFVCDLLWWNKDEPKPKNFTSKETGSHKLLEDFKASKQQSVSKDKDFEVTAYRYKLNGNVWQKVNAQRFELPNTQFWLSARDMADGLNYEIYSVKRLSDNEVFSVGDNHSGSSYSNRVVKGFIIKNDEMFIIQYGGNTKLKDAKKIKQPLFTTKTNNTMKVTIQIDQADNVASDLADLLCWWEGFKIGLKSAGVDHFIVAENGIEAARNLNVKIKDALKNIKQ